MSNRAWQHGPPYRILARGEFPLVVPPPAESHPFAVYALDEGTPMGLVVRRIRAGQEAPLVFRTEVGAWRVAADVEREMGWCVAAARRPG